MKNNINNNSYSFTHIISILFAALFLVFFSTTAQAEPSLPARPEPAKFFNDFSKIIPYPQAQALEAKLQKYSQATTNQLVIVTINSTQPNEIADYAFKLGRAWGIGQKDKNNGVLMLWATQDRKIFIATGYGVEGELTDALAKRIIETVIIPNFKRGDFYTGLDEGANAVIKILSGDVQYANQVMQQKAQKPASNKMFLLIFLIFIIFHLIARRLSPSSQVAFISSAGLGLGGGWGGGRSGGGWGGGSFGGGSFGGGGSGGSY